MLLKTLENIIRSYRQRWLHNNGTPIHGAANVSIAAPSSGRTALIIRKKKGFPIFSSGSPRAGNQMSKLSDYVDILPPKGIGLSVGPVIDDSRNKIGIPDTSKDVILCVGINYGQNLTNQIGLYDDTKMVPKLDRLLNLLKKTEDIPSDYHMVAANLFPWISSVPWGVIAERPVLEAALFWEYGIAGILQPLSDLRASIGDDLKYIVFHGANNAVPILGVLHGLTHSAGIITTPSIILTDNLVRPHHINNAVKLT